MLKIETLCDKMANTYLISNGKELLIIDPAIEVRTIKQIINKYYQKQNVVGIILTHGHYDHFTYLRETKEEFNCDVYVSKNDYSKLNDLNLSCANLFGLQKLNQFNGLVKFLSEGKIQISNFEIRVIFTPGHTNGSISVIIGNNIFTGDTLFLDGVGRTDLPTGNVIMLNQSLKKLMTLKENYQVFPGHGQPTTLEDERENNYYYQKIKNNRY